MDLWKTALCVIIVFNNAVHNMIKDCENLEKSLCAWHRAINQYWMSVISTALKQHDSVMEITACAQEISRNTVGHAIPKRRLSVPCVEIP